MSIVQHFLGQPNHLLGQDLVDELPGNPSYQLLKELFDIRTREWKYAWFEVEGGGIGTFYDLETSLEPWQAFQLILPASRLVIDQTDIDLIETAFFLLLGIIHAGDTTEIPDGLLDQLEMLQNRDALIVEAGRRSLFAELERWYRLGA
jgi:hypothetical protein